ncbi:SDR family NAD(P)-dependent oxidoreductase [Methylobacterium sp. C25]|uniref:SDR family NAD(P)-dependent oxidoreductase n=1 Tax=Methylobacterium sp. C25 TaxID=2721622 RepID=UPI001F1C3D8B|nr:SDR family NAD(P)-dependent oxidoreductase [Methylobacterium sp. C25]MCE4226214.1 SDR family NAD(P)-dependent oxidoreductase [Methylobacterium sp. C25]
MTNAVVIGASGGIGRAFTQAIADSDAYETVFALSRSDVSLPAPIRSATIDVTNEASVAAAAQATAAAGQIGLVVVASGILHGTDIKPEKAIRVLDPAAMAAVFAVNTIGPALVAKHFVPLMQRSGRSVFAALSARVGSIEDNRLGGWYAYRASKAALNQILCTLSIEAARTHPDTIIVGLHPGTVRTALSHPFRPDEGTPGVFTPEESAAYLMRVLDGLSAADSGKVFAWDGTVVPA